MQPNVLSAEQKVAIIRACEEHERQQGSQRDFRRCVVCEGFFVKFDNYSSLLPQYETQKYISGLADGDHNAPRIPTAHHFFFTKSMAYLVMEYIELASAPVPDLHERVARALQWLYDCPAPKEVTIGPVGGVCVRHQLFKDYTAPLSFSNVESLETYMNRVRPYLHLLSIRHPLTMTWARLLSGSRSKLGHARSALAMSRWSSPSPIWM